VQQTNWPYHLPELGTPRASKANRDAVAERFPEPAEQQRVEGDLALIDCSDPLRSDVELRIVQTATPPHAQTLSRLPAVPGSGKILSLVLLYDIHDIDRFPRVQDVVSSCRLIKCAKASAGTRVGTAGKNIGNAHLKWAFSEAAALCLRNNPAGQRRLARLEKRHDKGTALTILAYKLARAVYDMLKRNMAFDMDKFRHS
jgi:transposase